MVQVSMKEWSKELLLAVHYELLAWAAGSDVPEGSTLKRICRQTGNEATNLNMVTVGLVTERILVQRLLEEQSNTEIALATQKPADKPEGGGSSSGGVATAVICLVRDNSTGKYLFTQRSSNSSHHPLEWECPAGKIEPGETSLEAALRELKEEVDIVPFILGEPSRLEVEGWVYDVYLCIAPLAAAARINEPEECVGLVWADLSAQEELSTTPYTYAAIRQADRLFEGFWDCGA